MDMNSGKFTLWFFPLVLLLFSVMFAAGAATGASEVTVNMRPDTIVVNAQGSFDDILAAIPMGMAAGHSIHDFDITMEFDGIHVSDAFALDYCYIDHIYFASFDRQQLQQNPDVLNMVNTTVTARVAGWIETRNVDNDSIIMDFYGSDEVDIVEPEPCWGDFDGDGDADAADLAELTLRNPLTTNHVSLMAESFGRADCPLTPVGG